MAASISCRPAPLRVFAARRPAARPMRAGYRVFAAVDKVQVRLWVFLRGNVPKCRAFWPADWRQIASSDTCVLTRNVIPQWQLLSFCRLLDHTHPTDCLCPWGAPCGWGEGGRSPEQCKQPLARLQPPHSLCVQLDR